MRAMNPIPLSWTIGGAAVLLAALGASSWLLYDSIEDKGRLAARIEERDRKIVELADAVRASEAEAAAQRSIAAAGQERIAALESEKATIRGRIQIVVKEVYRAPDAYSPAAAALRVALARLRELDAAASGGDKSRAAGAPGGPAAGPGAAPSATGAGQQR